MRGLDDRLARIARRDELRQRTRSDAHRPDGSDPGASPVVDEVADALRAVVGRNPGVFATVVVQEAETAWSVWIGEWDGTLRTRVTRLEPDPPGSALTVVPEPGPLMKVADPDPGDEPTRPLTPPLTLVPPAASVAPAAPAAASTPPALVPAASAPTSTPAAAPVPARTPLSVVPDAEPDSAPGSVDDIAGLPRRRRRAVPTMSRALPAGPTRQPGELPVTELLRPRRPLDDEISASAPTPPMGFRPLASITPEAITPEAATALPDRSTPLDPAAPLPKRIPDSGIPLPRRQPGLAADLATADDPDPIPTRVPGRFALATSDGVGPLAPPEVPLVAAAPATLPAPEDTIWPPHAPMRHRPTPEADPRPADPHMADPHMADPHMAEPQPAEHLDQTAVPAPTVAAPPLAAAPRVLGPAMNDKVAGRIADMLRREAKRDNSGITS